jgi:hypothetical protein
MALIETLETGKPITQARAEVAGAADLWRYAAALARTQCGDSHNGLGPEMLAMVLKEPIGVVSIITPWNFPFWILSQKAALRAGRRLHLRGEAVGTDALDHGDAGRIAGRGRAARRRGEHRAGPGPAGRGGCWPPSAGGHGDLHRVDRRRARHRRRRLGRR